MKGLLLKEWYAVWSNSTFLIAAGVMFFCSILSKTSLALLLSCGVMISVLMATFPSDEYKWTQTVLNSPLGWPRLIAAKYLFCLLCGAGLVVYWFLFNYILFWGNMVPGMAANALLFFSYSVILTSVYIPCVYRFKYTTANTILVTMFLLLLGRGLLIDFFIRPKELIDAFVIVNPISLLALGTLLISVLATYEIFRQRYGAAEWRNTK